MRGCLDGLGLACPQMMIDRSSVSMRGVRFIIIKCAFRAIIITLSPPAAGGSWKSDQIYIQFIFIFASFVERMLRHPSGRNDLLNERWLCGVTGLKQTWMILNKKSRSASWSPSQQQPGETRDDCQVELTLLSLLRPSVLTRFEMSAISISIRLPGTPLVIFNILPATLSSFKSCWAGELAEFSWTGIGSESCKIMTYHTGHWT